MSSLSSLQHALREEAMRDERRKQEAQRFREEAALQAAGVPQLIAENARLMKATRDAEWGKHVREERRRLILESSPDWNPPKYANNLDSQTVELQARKAWASYLSSPQNGIGIEGLTAEYVRQFVSANFGNNCDVTNSETFFSAARFILSRLTRPAPALPEAAEVRVVEEEREPHNPHPPSDRYESDYCRWERNKAQSDSYGELVPVWRQWIGEIATAAGLEVPELCMKQCWQLVSRGDKRFSFTRSGVRRAWFYLFGDQCPDACFEGTEKGVMQVDHTPDSMSAEEYRCSIGGLPNFSRSGAPVRDLRGA